MRLKNFLFPQIRTFFGDLFPRAFNRDTSARYRPDNNHVYDDKGELVTFKESHSIVLFDTRDTLFKALPRHGIAAEIGVAKGKFARKVLEYCRPQKFHLIDPWKFQNDPSYLEDKSNADNLEQENRYQNVKRMFRKEIQSGRVQLHRTYSYIAVKEFPDNYFDWINIDGMHTYDAVLKDLEDFYPKTKDTGLICGHDYANHLFARENNFGVIEAVHDFIKKYNCHLKCIQIGRLSSYVIAKKAEGDFLQHFFNRLLQLSPQFILRVPSLNNRPLNQTYIQLQPKRRPNRKGNNILYSID